MVCYQNNWEPIKIGQGTATATIYNVALYVVFVPDLKAVAI